MVLKTAVTEKGYKIVGKYTYLVTIECTAYKCVPTKEMDFYTLNYPLATKKDIGKFLKQINPDNYYVRLVILFIRNVSG